MASTKVNTVKAKNDALKTEKSPWLEYFQLIGEFIHQRKLEFTGANVSGTFLNREIFDNTAARNNQVMASALVGALWSGGANSIKIMPAFGVSDKQINKDYYQFFEDSLIEVMDAPKAGFTNSFNEFMLDETSFGTSGIGVFRNDDSESKRDVPYRYSAWNVKTMSIAEDRWGIVDTIYDEKEMTISAAAHEFGIENLSKKSREAFEANKGDTEKIKILHAIEPRRKRNPAKFGNKDMPWASIHIELGADKIIKESGFESMPVKVVRFTKLLGEVYGRGAGGNAIPDAIELNAIWEALTIATEKTLDPPLGILNDGDLTPVINTSAGALTVFNVTGRLSNQPPIFPLFTVGELKAVEPLVEKLVESLANHFFLDRLLDLNNDTRMTFGEAQIRNELRAASLGSIFSRQIEEGLIPLIDRTVELMFIDGKLGVMPSNGNEIQNAIIEGREVKVIPDEIAKKIEKGEEFFKIKFITPASRAMNAEQVQGLLATLSFTTQAAGVDADARDVIDVDAAVKRIAELTGAPEEVIRSLDAIEKLREARNSQAAQSVALEEKRQESEIARNFAQAASIANNTGGGGGRLNQIPLGT